MCFIHSPESKMNISFNAQICFCRVFMNMITIYMYVLFIYLLIDWKKSPGKAFKMLSLEGESLVVKQM